MTFPRSGLGYTNPSELVQRVAARIPEQRSLPRCRECQNAPCTCGELPCRDGTAYVAVNWSGKEVGL